MAAAATTTTTRKLKKYQLIKFIGVQIDETSLLDIDRVPLSWVRYDIDEGQAMTKFPPPPYTIPKQNLLERLIKSQSSPVPSWPEYAVELVGHADTYKQADGRLKILETQSFAFTSESDTAPRVIASEVLQQLKQQSIDELLKVPRMESEDEAASSISPISHLDSESSSEKSLAAPRRSKSKKGLGKRTKQTQKNTVSKFEIGTSRPSNCGKKRESNSSHASKSLKPTPSEATQKSVLQLKSTSKIVSDTSKDCLLSEVDTDEDLRQGTYVVQESGELEFDDPSLEQQSVSRKDKDSIFGTETASLTKKQESNVSRLLKSSKYDQSLSQVSDILRRAENTYTEDTLLILRTLKGLSIDLNDNTNAINNLCATINAMDKTSGRATAEPRALGLETGIELPFKTLEEFKKFDSRLHDLKYRQQCADSLLFYVDRNNHVAKSVTNILKKFVGRDVCMDFTAVKQVAEKAVFKTTRFCKIMFDVITTHHTDNQGQRIAEKYFFHCLGQAIANSKDWDGCRVERAKKAKAKNEKKEREKAARKEAND